MSNPLPGPTPPESTAPMSPPEQRAREFLAHGKWRKARDELKPLVKLDRSRFLPLLIDANVGLTRELMAKGQRSEAEQVLHYLRTIAPPNRMRAIELELTLRDVSSPALAQQAFQVLTEDSELASKVDRASLADAVVLATEVPSGGGPAGAHLLAEAQAIQDALLAISQARWDDVSPALRNVPHRSPFNHWTAFCRGLVAFYRGDPDRAQKYFLVLPANSPTSKVGEACLILAGRRDVPEARAKGPDPILQVAFKLSGAGPMGPALWQAEVHWMNHQPTLAYGTLRKAIPEFPSSDATWLGSVSEFFFHAPHTMPAEDTDRFLSFLDDLGGHPKNNVEEMGVHRVLALLGWDAGSSAGLRWGWERFVELYQGKHGQNPRLASRAYGWLGEKLSVVHMGGGRASQKDMRDATGAVEVLRKAISLDPTNLSAHLCLCSVYEHQKQSGPRNSLVDSMAVRFPENKQVLLFAVRACIDRHAYKKALGLLDRIRELDQLDPAIPDLIVTAQRRLARRQFEGGNRELGRRTLAQVEAWLNDQPADLQRSRWTSLLRHSLMERLWGDESEAEALLTRAIPLAPQPAAFWLFAHLAYCTYAGQNAPPGPFQKNLVKALSAAPGLSPIPLLLDILLYWTRNEPIDSHEVKISLLKAIREARRHPCTRGDILQVLERALRDPAFETEARELIDLALKKDPRDPQFRLLQLTKSDPWTFNDDDDRRESIESILAEATRRHDDASVRMARHLLQELDRGTSGQPDPNVDSVEESLDELMNGPLDFASSGMDPVLLEVLELLRNAPEREIRRLRKSRPRGMPLEIFDDFVRMAREGVFEPPQIPAPAPASPKSQRPPPTPTPRGPRPPKAVDPNQEELF